MRIGLVGFGEVGAGLARGLAGAGASGMLAWKPSPFTEQQQHAAAEAGVVLAESPGALAAAGLVISAVPPSVAREAARTTIPHLAPGAIYFDLNSASPKAKQAIAELASGHGVHVVDAVMLGGGIQLEGYRAPVLAAGPEAGRAASVLALFGMNISVIGQDVGQASQLKLFRSVVVKGMEALLIEMLQAAEQAGLGEVALRTLGEAFCPDFAAYANMLVTTHAVHAARRAGELAMAKEVMEEFGVRPSLTAAVAEAFQETVRLGVREKVGARVPARWQDVVTLVGDLQRGGVDVQ